MLSQDTFGCPFGSEHTKICNFPQVPRMKAARAAPVGKLVDATKMASRLEIALLALLGLLWGMPYALTKIALATIPPVTLVAARVALAAAVLWIIVLFMGCKIPARRDFVGGLFVQGCLGCARCY